MSRDRGTRSSNNADATHRSGVLSPGNGVLLDSLRSQAATVGCAAMASPSSSIEAACFRRGRSGASRDCVVALLRRFSQARPRSRSNAKSFRH
ncbi:hypothetical protein GLA29479_882 [Lysobacter antibioticus]|nr:hypothetical protein GLA29479_882 [Lysobacter antibioticus]